MVFVDLEGRNIAIKLSTLTGIGRLRLHRDCERTRYPGSEGFSLTQIFAYF
jgi:hypothetical protein